jgi:glutamine amidotransferase
MVLVGILDAEMGNLKSVYNAVNIMGYDAKIINSENDFGEMTHLIIPGVGSFNKVMEGIDKTGLKQKIRSFAASRRPLLGICLGMQLFADFGVEHGWSEGLGLIVGKVDRLKTDTNFPLPHVGWNTVRFLAEHPIFKGVKTERDFYFVHSYNLVCCDRANVLGTTNYGDDFVSIVGKDNIIGFQFHPEKSQANGLKLIENFCEWDGRC